MVLQTFSNTSTSVTLPSQNLSNVLLGGLVPLSNVPVVLLRVVNGAATIATTPAAGTVIYIPGISGESVDLTIGSDSINVIHGRDTITVRNGTNAPLKVRINDYLQIGPNFYQYVGYGSTGLLTIGSTSPSVACFLEDAPVLTPRGYKRIGRVRPGDMITAEDGKPVKVVNVVVQMVLPGKMKNPYIVPKGLYGATRDLPISCYHAIKIETGEMVMAKDLKLQLMEMPGPFKYYNLELERNVNMIIAGVTVESWHLR